MKLFCYEIQLCKEFAEVCIFCGSFIINSFWTHLSYVLKTGRRLFWKNEAKVRKRAWFISSCIVKLEMAKKVHFQMSKIGEKHWLVSSMTFRFPFHLLVLFYNKYFSQVSILKSCWPIHFQIISPTFQKKLIRSVIQKRTAAFAPISFAIQWNAISNDNIQSFQLSFELLVQLQTELEGNLLDQKLDELENELSRI